MQSLKNSLDECNRKLEASEERFQKLELDLYKSSKLRNRGKQFFKNELSFIDL
jgi:hypothetical protein